MALAKRLREADGGRTLLIPLEARAGRVLVLALTLGLAAWLAALIVRPAVATYLAALARSVEELESALAWDPKSPTLHLQLARAYESVPDYDRARAHFEAARHLRPTDAYPWLGLALLAERRRNMAEARQAFDTALRLDPHNVHLRWEAALFAFRRGDRERALDGFRYVLAVDPSQRDAAFQLARLLLNPGEDPARLLPSEPRTLTSVLLAAVDTQDATLAEAAWRRRTALEPALPRDVGRRYLNFVLAEGDGGTARRVWGLLMPNGASPENRVWNGGFEHERLLGWGLDWRVAQTWGVEVTLDRFVAARGRHSLRLYFNSFPALNFAGVWQLAGVEPGREYRLRAVARATDFVTRSGVKLQIVLPKSGQVLAETPAIAGTTADWMALETGVRIPPETSLVAVRLRREPAPAPEGNLGGKVWVDEVSLR